MRAIMSDRARLQRMLDFEAALARAEAAVGVITATGAVEIGDACRAELYDIAALVEAAIPSGNIAIAVVNALTLAGRPAQQGGGELRALGRHQPGRHRHRAGARTARGDRCAARRPRPRDQGLHHAGRTPSPHAGGRPHADAARAADAVRAQACGLRRGAGALARTAAAAAPRGAGAAIRRRRRHAWRRSASTASAWPSGSRRCSTCSFPTRPGTATATAWPRSRRCFGILAGTCGKIARDVALMMQIEVGEAFEPAAPGRGVSSTLPHKRNPTGAAAALSAATIAPNLVATILAAQVQEHERGVGGWQTEWLTFPDARAGHLGRARRRRPDRRRPGDRRRAPARQPRTERRPDHGRSGVVRARRKNRTAGGAPAGAGAEPAGRKGEAAAQGRAAHGPPREGAIEQRRDRKVVHPADLPGLGADSSSIVWWSRARSRTRRPDPRPEVKLPTAEPKLPTAPQLPPIHSTEIPAPVEEVAKLAQRAEAAAAPSRAACTNARRSRGNVEASGARSASRRRASERQRRRAHGAGSRQRRAAAPKPAADRPKTPRRLDGRAVQSRSGSRGASPKASPSRHDAPANSTRRKPEPICYWASRPMH